MSGVLGAVAWADTAEALYERYASVGPCSAGNCLPCLFLFPPANRSLSPDRQAGVGERTVVRWLGWYRAGGLEALLARTPGHGAAGAAPRLSEEQQGLLVQESARGAFRTCDEARAWVRERFGVDYRYHGLYSLLGRRLGVRPKVPRPSAARADPGAPEAWKRGGSRRP